MTPQDTIRISRWLRAREAAFVTVHTCEAGIRQRLEGSPFPFPPFPGLPSRRQRPRALPRATPPAAADALRRLQPGEDAFRVTGVCQGVPFTSLCTDPDAVRALLASPPEALAVGRVEALRLDDEGAVTGSVVLWERETAPPAPPPPAPA